MIDHAQLMIELSNKHNIISDLIGGGRFHYVDYPVHGNVGDLLIMKGTLEFFRKNALNPEIVAPFSSYSPSWAKDDCTIVFHGGGNLGDIYKFPQALREKVIQQCRGNRIIILPQTIYFQSRDAWERCLKIFNGHSDLHIFVRDEKSFELGKKLTPNIYLVPDMAHQLYPLRNSFSQGKGLLAIQRIDGEKTGIELCATTVTDWPKFVGSSRASAARSIIYASHAFYLSGLGKAMVPLWRKIWFSMANTIIDDAIRFFAQHEAVVSDRLHAHILSCLMDMPNTVYDNAYGKNSSYVQAWTKGSPLVNII